MPRFAMPLFAALVLCAASAPAQTRSYARDDTSPIDKQNWPDEVLRRPLTLAQGMTQLSVPVTFNLSTDAVGEPVYVPAILAFGVSDAVTVSITHQIGICLTGTSHGCPKAYNDIGVQGMFALAPRGPVQAALVAGLQAPSLTDPFASAAIVGFDSRYTNGVFAFRLDPRFAIGLSERDAAVSSYPVPVALDFHGAPIIAVNRETLFVPIALQLQATSNVALTLGSGVAAQLDPLSGSVADNLSVPLGVSVAYTMRMLDVGASFGFPNLRGPNGVSGVDERVGQVFATIRL